MKFKFPQAKQKVADMSLATKIKSTGKQLETENDILRRGLIGLDFSKVTELRSSVKSMVNALINHGNQKYQIFKEAMLSVFEPVEALDK